MKEGSGFGEVDNAEVESAGLRQGNGEIEPLGGAFGVDIVL